MEEMTLQRPVHRTGMIFDIQRYSIHDGPGIRTVVFFKGCPLRCPWCSNPESQKGALELSYSAIDCVLCKSCVSACPREAITELDGKIHIDRKACNACGRCWDVCVHGALKPIGKMVTVGEVLSVVEKDRVFYERTGGGVTLSGGEPLAQPDFCYALLQACKSKGLHTAMETTGYQKWSIIEPILEYVDLVLLDIKTMDSERHKEVTGVANDVILSNARKAAEIGKRIIVRVPIIPGYNNTKVNIELTAKFAVEIAAVELHVLPYHRLGEAKYARLGREYLMKGTKEPSSSEMGFLAQVAREVGVVVQIGG